MTKTREKVTPPKIRAWNEITEDVTLPTDFMAAFMTGRPEILRIINRPLRADETASVARAMAVLIDTNQELQRHAARVLEMAEHTSQLINGCSVKLGELEDFAAFRIPADEE